MVICFTREHISIILQVAATANKIEYGFLGAAGGVSLLVSGQILR